MNRIFSKVRACMRSRSKIFCAFLTLGYPNLETTEKLISGFEKEGADLVELGFPFSDPLADGPTIQFSSERALEKKVRFQDAFALVERLRKNACRVPIIFFSYLNPIFHYGLKEFVKEAVRAGFDGLIVPDLPPEEERELAGECHRHKLAQIFLVAPTTEKKRAAAIARRSEGFIYYVSLRGVTGARKNLPSDIARTLHRFNGMFRKPVLIGFGVSNPKQARELAHISQGVIVGSAIVDSLRKSHGRIGPVLKFVREMVRAVKR